MSASESCLAAPRRANLFTGACKSIGILYCRWFHGAISRPVHGKYRCWRCLREFELEW